MFLHSLNWQIFPNGSCISITDCGGKGRPNLPDFSLKIDGVEKFHIFGVTPGTSDTYPNSVCGAAFNPCDGSSAPETAPQAIGHYEAPGSGWVVNNNIVFSDWPAAIGIDSVKISRTEVPQPTASMLVALDGALLGWRLTPSVTRRDPVFTRRLCAAVRPGPRCDLSIAR